jgi:hypothetical protein
MLSPTATFCWIWMLGLEIRAWNFCAQWVVLHGVEGERQNNGVCGFLDLRGNETEIK